LKSRTDLTTTKQKREFLDVEIAKRAKEWRRTEQNGGKRFESRIVSEDELTSYLDEGWDLVKELTNGKIVIRRAIEA